MYECFSIVFFHSAGSDVVEMETIIFSLFHPVRQSYTMQFFSCVRLRLCATIAHAIQELRYRITHALQTITAAMLHRVWDEFDYRVDVCLVTQGACIEGS
jgi:hypothetical protein